MIGLPSRITLESERGQAIRQAHSRIVWITICFTLAYVLVAVRVFDLAVLQAKAPPERLETASYEQAVDTPPVTDTVRGKIFDRNGALLAASLPMDSLAVDPKLIIEEERLASQLVKIFPDLERAALMKDLSNKKSRFRWVKRNISPEEKAAVLALGQPGLQFHEEYKRIYPQGALGGHLLGYTNIDSKGLAGIERNFEEVLQGGENVTLALDIRLQHLLRQEIGSAIATFSAKAGAGVIMDVHNGEVLAGVSLPDFDPHNPGSASDPQLFNRLTLGAYELGSLFKIFSTAALLDLTDTPIDYKFDAREPLKAGGRTINDYHAEKRILSLPEVFIYSSNIGSAMMGQMVGTDGLRNFYRDLGLLDPMDIEIKEVATPLIPNPWREVDTLTAAFGHGGTTTVMQVASAISSIVNGGALVQPELLPAEKDGKETIQIVSKNTSEKMRDLLRLVVTDGTASKAEVPGYLVGGKTGTAEKVSASGGYDKHALISSFAGIFPANDPRYLVLVMVDEPKGTKASYGYATAGWVAAPAAAHVIEGMAAILNIPPIGGQQSMSSADPLRQYINFEAKGALR